MCEDGKQIYGKFVISKSVKRNMHVSVFLFLLAKANVFLFLEKKKGFPLHKGHVNVPNVTPIWQPKMWLRKGRSALPMQSHILFCHTSYGRFCESSTTRYASFNLPKEANAPPLDARLTVRVLRPRKGVKTPSAIAAVNAPKCLPLNGERYWWTIYAIE